MNSLFYRINSATANRAVASLVDRGILLKQRGIGMFVAEGAPSLIDEMELLLERILILHHGRVRETRL